MTTLGGVFFLEARSLSQPLYFLLAHELLASSALPLNLSTGALGSQADATVSGSSHGFPGSNLDPQAWAPSILPAEPLPGSEEKSEVTTPDCTRAEVSKNPPAVTGDSMKLQNHPQVPLTNAIVMGFTQKHLWIFVGPHQIIILQPPSSTFSLPALD